MTDTGRVMWIKQFKERVEKFQAPEPYEDFWVEFQINASTAQMARWQKENMSPDGEVFIAGILARVCRGWSVEGIEPSRESFEAMPGELQQWCWQEFIAARNAPLGKKLKNGSVDI